MGDENILATLSEKIKPGMEQFEVEKNLRGYRHMEVGEDKGQSIVRYGYWFGFIPPFWILQMKYIGEVIVVYSSDGKVMESSFWIN